MSSVASSVHLTSRNRAGWSPDLVMGLGAQPESCPHFPESQSRSQCFIRANCCSVPEFK